jgi:putative DNA primase/helicase
MSLQNIPAELKAFNNFVGWKLETREGKETKPPYDINRNDYAKTNNAATWATFDRAVEVSDPLSGTDSD